MDGEKQRRHRKFSKHRGELKSKLNPRGGRFEDFTHNQADETTCISSVQHRSVHLCAFVELKRRHNIPIKYTLLLLLTLPHHCCSVAFRPKFAASEQIKRLSKQFVMVNVEVSILWLNNNEKQPKYAWYMEFIINVHWKFWLNEYHAWILYPANVFFFCWNRCYYTKSKTGIIETIILILKLQLSISFLLNRMILITPINVLTSMDHTYQESFSSVSPKIMNALILTSSI